MILACDPPFKGNSRQHKLHDDKGKIVSFGGETRIGDVLAVIVGILATPTMTALTSIPEDLVSAVRTCLAYSMKRLTKIQILVREPLICHKVAFVTTVCMNKTGTLTMASMESSSSSPINSTEKIIFEWAVKQLGMDVESMAESCLRCIAFAHRKTLIRDFIIFQQQLILLSLVGLTNSRRSGTRETMEDCRRVGISIKLITEDNKVTATIMATKCRIIEPDYQPGEMIDGEEFRKFSLEERMAKIENICVLARATPDDKLLMVQSLKQKGHVVAFIGRRIGDTQTLREANVGLCFGTQEAEIIKACSAIVMSCKVFPLIIDILTWGRGLYDSVHIYTQFLLIASFAALVIDFVTAVSSSEHPGLNAVVAISTGKFPFPVFQLLWMKLIAGTLAVLALNIEKSSQDLMRRPPRNLKEPLITAQMHKKIGPQALYQIAIFLVIHFKGKSLFDVNDKEKNSLVLST
ncbi:calcium-transporting ATPase 12, plasma membrane-type-like [Olea europaea var. sylvestris]|uniref:calcium-transporting ATPase 12, plasma membrane-type-like n=1 Tax=Olea europaea var. sylvestris TaxID=158386 RepID=UPI000C1D5835|nr:calcium-transporting ATPase 12, plasma membrane-type-like [Olea europaea var. sylvestris]